LVSWQSGIGRHQPVKREPMMFFLNWCDFTINKGIGQFTADLSGLPDDADKNILHLFLPSEMHYI
jgi:hypothetical protein